MYYLFMTKVCMHNEKDCEKGWYIDRDFVQDISVREATLPLALQKYREAISDTITISDSAFANKEKVYRDTPTGREQTGYCFMGSLELQDDTGKYVKKYIDLWVDVLCQYDFEEGY